jgi:hypothetical protein
MSNPRCYHTTTLLPNGRILVAGGGSSSAELYDPAAGTWSVTGEMSDNRSRHTATLLPNGKVLVAGGELNEGDYYYLSSAALYNPATEKWMAAAPMTTNRSVHTATLLPDGRVLVVGGYVGRPGVGAQTAQMSTELYDPTSGIWSATAGMHDPRSMHTATLLPNGKVLVAGGYTCDNGGEPVTTADLYNPTTGTWTAVGTLNTARGAHSATLLPSGEVLVAGGNNGSHLGDLSSAELFEQATGSWIGAPTMNDWHSLHTATLLPDGRVLIAAGFRSSAELYVPVSGIRLIAQPQGQMVYMGDTVSFSVSATCDTAPLNYQWRFQPVGAAMVNLSGATNSVLVIDSATAAHSGAYSVRVWNDSGSVGSRAASLSVVTDGANGTQPLPVADTATLLDTPGANNLILVTHGWRSSVREEWLTGLVDALKARVPANWAVLPYDWEEEADTGVLHPDLAREHARSLGRSLGIKLSARNYGHVHFIAHSAGSALIDNAARWLKGLHPATTVHCPFLDPYTGSGLWGRSYYGEAADWSDNYFVHDWLTDTRYSRDSTEGPLVHAFNVDVVGTLSSRGEVPGIWSGTPYASTAISLPPSAAHDSPCWFYLSTVNGTADLCVRDYGYGFSKEAGSGDWAQMPTRHEPGGDPLSLCAGLAAPQSQPQPRTLWVAPTLGTGAFGTSPSGVQFDYSKLQLDAVRLPPPSPRGKGDPQRGPKDFVPGVPAWYAQAIEITNLVNFVTFQAAFTSTNGANGLLTTYWNTNLIGTVDERVAGTDWQTYDFPLPLLLSQGTYTLSFRLDSFENQASSILITNVAIGYRGLTNPITLRMVSWPTNVPMALELEAPAGFNYLVESSTNLLEWTPAALLVNTNGSVVFPDPAITNSSQRFYRAMLY